MKIGFDGGIRLEFHGAKVTSDGGLLAYRDLDDALGLFDSVSGNFHDNRTGRNIQHDDMSTSKKQIFSCNFKNLMLNYYHNSNKSQLISFRELIWGISD